MTSAGTRRLDPSAFQQAQRAFRQARDRIAPAQGSRSYLLAELAEAELGNMITGDAAQHAARVVQHVAKDARIQRLYARRGSPRARRERFSKLVERRAAR